VHFDSNRESTFVLSLNAIMQKLNGLLSKLYTLPTGKINILYYLLIFFVCSLVFIIVMGGVSWKYIGPPLIEIIKKISAFFPKKEKEKTA
jgi:sensor histidine kinase YesM